MLHPDFDYGLGKERVVQMRKEVEHHRLESSLAKAAHLSECTIVGANNGAGFAAL